MGKKFANKEVDETVEKVPLIKLMIDYKTTIFVKSQQSLESWLERYPNAKIIEG
jgi:hypothetical protein